VYKLGIACNFYSYYYYNSKYAYKTYLFIHLPTYLFISTGYQTNGLEYAKQVLYTELPSWPLVFRGTILLCSPGWS
jgi:hypothetical protein